MNRKIVLALGISLVFVMGFSAALTSAPSLQQTNKPQPQKEMVHRVIHDIGKNTV